MFTGIIEEIGGVNKRGDTLEITCKTVLEDTKIGDSIAVNGCCQTVVALSPNSFTVRVSPETLRVANLSSTCVNLERAMRADGRFGGHFVTGHVDFTGRLVDKRKTGDFWELSYEVPDTKYIVHKGSVAVNGVSLTIASIQGNIFKVAVIPHTYENTCLDGVVNIETDILGKYVVKGSGITMKLLEANGFI
jgi:riboflavin synthase